MAMDLNLETRCLRMSEHRTYNSTLGARRASIRYLFGTYPFSE